MTSSLRPTILSLITMFSLLLSGVHSAKKESIAKLAGVGDQLELKCVVAEEIKNCIFRNPAEDNLFMFVGADIENGRVVNSAFGLNEATGRYECNMMIKNVKDTDNGRWECSVIAINEGQQKTVTRYFQVTVAVPPEQLYLEENNQKRPNELKFGMSSEEKKVSCIAENVRPKPEFVWYIGDNKMNVAAEDFDRDWNKTTMKATYGQTFSYYPSKEHNDKSLVCEINHSGYTDAQKAAEANKVAVRLLITFPPETQDKVDTVDLSALTKKELDGGQSVGKTVPIRKTFSANPMPTECYWQIGQNETAVVKCGQKSEDDKYLSSNVEQGDDENRWTVVLDIDISQFAKEDTPEDVTLIVGNGEGKAAYKFNLTAAEDVTTTSKRTGGAQASMTAVAVVIVVLILVVVSIVAYARVKGLLCFAVKTSKDDDTEQTVDKEGSDTESTEHGVTKPSENGDAGAAGSETADEGGKQGDTNEEAVDAEDQKAKKPASMASKMTNLIAAVRKSVNGKTKEKYEPSESEAKLNDEENKKDTDSVEKADNTGTGHEDYAELDQKALTSGPKSNFNVEDEKATVYTEIRPPQ